jgi:hypothetical protein
MPLANVACLGAGPLGQCRSGRAPEECSRCLTGNSALLELLEGGPDRGLKVLSLNIPLDTQRRPDVDADAASRLFSR